jgi:hypothetical protein
MHPRLLILALASAALTACMSFPDVQTIRGERVKLSWSDIRELNEIVASHPNIRKPLAFVYLYSPNRAGVKSGAIYTSNAPITEFFVHKYAGHWVLDESSIHQTKAMFLQ